VEVFSNNLHHLEGKEEEVTLAKILKVVKALENHTVAEAISNIKQTLLRNLQLMSIIANV